MAKTSGLVGVHDGDPSDPFAEILGAFVIAFGSLDATAVEWCRHRAEDRKELKGLLRRKFASRVKWIVADLPNSALGYPEQAEAIEGWGEALEFARLRNELVHNPVVFSWEGGDHGGPPDHVEMAIIHRARGEFLQEVDRWDLLKLPPITAQLEDLVRRLLPHVHLLRPALGLR